MIEANELCKLFERHVRSEDEEFSGENGAGKVKQRGKKRKKDKTKKEAFYAVDHVSIHADAGEIIGILGPNGAGKTTLLRMLGMLMTPTQGSLRITDGAGNAITDRTEQKKAIGYLSGNTKLYPRFSIREYLTFLGDLYELDRQKTEERIAEIFQVLDMDPFGDNRIERLSTGQLQRASIARCLMADPEIYILDEPTLGLDILSADAIIHFMKEQKKRGKTVLYSTHYLEEAQFLCDRIYMILNGRIQAQGTVQELLDMTQTANLREAFHVICDRAETGNQIGKTSQSAETGNRVCEVSQDVEYGKSVMGTHDETVDNGQSKERSGMNRRKKDESRKGLSE